MSGVACMVSVQSKFNTKKNQINNSKGRSLLRNNDNFYNKIKCFTINSNLIDYVPISFYFCLE